MVRRELGVVRQASDGQGPARYGWAWRGKGPEGHKIFEGFDVALPGPARQAVEGLGLVRQGVVGRGKGPEGQ